MGAPTLTKLINSNGKYKLYDPFLDNCFYEADKFKSAYSKKIGYEDNRLFICILRTGSSGNCTIIKYNEDIILIDFGYKNRKDFISDLAGIGLKPEDITVALNTHGHSDHYLKSIHNLLKKEGVKVARKPKKQYCQEIHIEAFENDHDDMISVGYVFTIKDFKFVWVTDSADMYAVPLYEYDLLCLECDYDKTGLKRCLDEGIYHRDLVKRIIRAHTEREYLEEWKEINYPDVPLIPLHPSKNSLSQPIEPVMYYTVKIKGDL